MIQPFESRLTPSQRASAQTLLGHDAQMRRQYHQQELFMRQAPDTSTYRLTSERDLLETMNQTIWYEGCDEDVWQQALAYMRRQSGVNDPKEALASLMRDGMKRERASTRESLKSALARAGVSQAAAMTDIFLETLDRLLEEKFAIPVLEKSVVSYKM